MKKTVVLSVLIFCFFGLLDAQTRISDEKMEVRGDSVIVSFSVDATEKVPSRYKEIIIPYISSGKDTMWFVAMEIFGRDRYMKEKQQKYLEGNKDWELGRNQSLSGDTISYLASVPLKRWMTSADFGLARHMAGCNCEKEHSQDTLKRDVSLFEEPVMPPRRIPEYVLEDASRRWDLGHDELEITFRLSKAIIDPSVFDNKVTFEKILDAVDNIHSNPNYRIEKLHVAGYASPEGDPRFNTLLGISRAKALIRYIIRKRPDYGLTEDHFEIHNGEENWEGLRRVLVASQMEGKDDVIAIIDSASLSGEAKKAAIKSMNYGRIWYRMLREIYPHLRCARYLAVYYDSTDDHAVEHINAANNMIRDGHYEQAYEALSKLSDDNRAFNSIGVSLMMQGRFEEAMPWFEKALEGGSKVAGANVDAIKAEWDYETRRKKEIEEYLNKYN